MQKSQHLGLVLIRMAWSYVSVLENCERDFAKQSPISETQTKTKGDSMTLEFPIKTSYVKHWGLWEATRELLQNAYDERDRTGAKVEFLHDDDVMYIKSHGQLDRQDLLFGSSDKTTSRGKFGEGFKLAMLVFLRLGCSITIDTGNKERWLPRIGHSEAWQSDVMLLDIETTDLTDTVIFAIHNVTKEQFLELNHNIYPEYGIIYDQPGRVYVGNLYVCTETDLHRGYSFSHKDVPLDRDRSMIHGWDLDSACAKFNAVGEHTYALLAKDAREVRFIEFQNIPKPLAKTVAQEFMKEHGDAIPVSDQQEIKQAQAAGVKWVLVPSVLKKVLRAVSGFFLPERKSPLERLRELAVKLSPEHRKELEDILESL